MSLSPSSSLLQSRLNAVFAGGSIDVDSTEEASTIPLSPHGGAAQAAASRLPWRQSATKENSGSLADRLAKLPGFGSDDGLDKTGHPVDAIDCNSPDTACEGTSTKGIVVHRDRARRGTPVSQAADSTRMQNSPGPHESYNVMYVESTGEYVVGDKAGSLLAQPGILEAEMSDILRKRAGPPIGSVRRDRQSDAFFYDQPTISMIDFVPSQPSDSVDDLLDFMNEWLVQEEARRDSIINVETVETEWPEPSVFSRASGGLVCRSAYWVRFLRVYYYSHGAPAWEQKFVRGDQATPQNFHALEPPVVPRNANPVTGTLEPIRTAAIPDIVKRDWSVLLLMMTLMATNSFLLIKSWWEQL